MKTAMIDANKLKLNRVPYHSELTPEEQTLCRITWDLIKDSGMCPSFEQWEYGFLLDMHPICELRIWLYIGNRYRESVRAMEDAGRSPAERVRNEMVSILCSLSMFPLDHPMRKEHDRKYRAVVAGNGPQ